MRLLGVCRSNTPVGSLDGRFDEVWYEILAAATAPDADCRTPTARETTGRDASVPGESGAIERHQWRKTADNAKLELHSQGLGTQAGKESSSSVGWLEAAEASLQGTVLVSRALYVMYGTQAPPSDHRTAKGLPGSIMNRLHWHLYVCSCWELSQIDLILLRQ